MNKYIYFIILSLFIFVSGCSTFKAGNINSVSLNPKTYYRHDMTMKINGVVSIGVTTVPRMDSYKIKVKTPGVVDAILFSTCHRQFFTDDIPGGWLVSRKKYEYKYVPNPEMETMNSCIMKIEAFEKGVKSRHSSGLIEFETPGSGETLKADVHCNGERWNANGVAVCMSYCPRNGDACLEQKIKFEHEVELSDELRGRCKIKISDDKKEWTYEIKNRECSYAFRTIKKINGKHEWFRILTVGYEAIPLRIFK